MTKKLIDYSTVAKEMLEALIQLKALNPDKEIYMVSGPISTGGKGSIKENLLFFDKAITDLRERGFFIFTQVPFEESLHLIKNNRIELIKFQRYDWDLLEECYLPLIQSKALKGMIFLPDYESSIGARWEYDKCLKYEKSIKHY